MQRVALNVVAFLPVSILLAIAGLQLYTAKNGLLTQWKGGGYGMFSTIDSPSTRVMRIILHTDSGTAILRSINRFATRQAISYPTDARLATIAEDVINDHHRLRYVYFDSTLIGVVTRPGSEQVPHWELRGVTVGVWSLVPRSDPFSLTYVPLVTRYFQSVDQHAGPIEQ